jgi:hypothetical protein
MDPIEALRRRRSQKLRRRGAESQVFSCNVTAEQVIIHLRRRSGSDVDNWFVQCDQSDASTVASMSLLARFISVCSLPRTSRSVALG